MPNQIHALREIPLLPDSELLEQLEEMQRQARKSTNRAGDRSSRRQLDRRLEALRAEVKNRGLGGPPWWAESA